jgi:peptidoglycan-N-acetylglucosamine deacetylase
MLMNFLTFDIEEWFHVPGHQLEARYWSGFEYRSSFIVDQILELLDKKKVKATFLVLGWLAREQPSVVKKIAAAGHQIGSHSDEHKLIYLMSRKDFQEDLKRSIDSIQSVIGQKVESFRAPSFSVKMETLGWFFDELIDAGIKYDLSIFPARRFKGGVLGTPSYPFKYDNESGSIYEFPINVLRLFGNNMVYSGGGYFRLIPLWFLKKLFSKADYNMTYFHPHDFDKGKPLPRSLGTVERWRRNCGVKTMFDKLEMILDCFNFYSIDDCIDKINFVNFNPLEVPEKSV